MQEQRKQDDDGDRYAQQPKQDVANAALAFRRACGLGGFVRRVHALSSSGDGELLP